MPGQPDQRNLIFSPRLPDRTYTPQFRSDLLAGTWTTLTDIATSDDGDDRTVTDLSAVEPVKFYRIQITPP